MRVHLFNIIVAILS